MLLLHEEPMDYSQFSAEQIQGVIAEYVSWRNQVESSGKLIGGEKLKDEGGRHLSGQNGTLRVTDGPYTVPGFGICCITLRSTSDTRTSRHSKDSFRARNMLKIKVVHMHIVCSPAFRRTFFNEKVLPRFVLPAHARLLPDGRAR